MKQFCRGYLCILIMFSITGMASSQEEWMPDPNLRKVVRTKLEIPDGIPMIIPDLQRLYDIVSFDADVESLQGLEHAVNLRFLHIGGGRISNLTPLVGLKNLHILKLHDQHISDISPLAEIKSLEVVHLQSNRINDFTPLLELPNLKEVRVSGNPGDIGQLIGLGLESIKICDVPRSSTTDRIENRSYMYDVNADGIVNILDLVAVANGFGKDSLDVNGDGVVNILDLVAVANQFGQ